MVSIRPLLRNFISREVSNVKSQLAAGAKGQLNSVSESQLPYEENTQNPDQSRNDYVATLSSMIEREIYRLESATESSYNPTINQQLDAIPTDTSDMQSVIRTISTNITIVDNKVKVLDRAMQAQKNLIMQTKHAVGRTTEAIESMAREVSRQRFSDIENKMEAEHLNRAIDKKVHEAIKAAGINQNGGGPSIFDSVLGLLGNVAAGGAAGAGGVLAAGGVAGLLRLLGPAAAVTVGVNTLFGDGLGTDDEMPTDKEGIDRVMRGEAAAREADRKRIENMSAEETEELRKLREKNIEADALKREGLTSKPSINNFSVLQDMDTIDWSVNETSVPNLEYENLMQNNDASRIDPEQSTFFGDFNFFDLIAQSFFVKTERTEMSSRNDFNVSADGTINLTSQQKIILSAPNIVMNGRVVMGDQASSSSSGGGGDAGGGGGPGSSQPRSGDPTRTERRTVGGTIPASGGGSGGSAADAAGGAGGRVGQAYRFFKSKGWSDAQIAGLLGNLQAESGAELNPGAIGDGGQAFGIAQWNRKGSPDRYANFQKLYGKDLTESTFEEQLEFIDWELNHSESGAGRRLRAAKDPATAAMVVSNHYERPNKQYAHNDRRVANANAIAGNSQQYIADAVPGDEGGGSAESLGKAPVEMTNQGAVRKYDVDPALKDAAAQAVHDVYGPGYKVEIYSGGQDEAGRRKLDSSTRHDIQGEHNHSKAGDMYIVGPDGKRVRGEELAKLGQYWNAKKIGGAGLEMKGGGIHLDLHKNRAPNWYYGNESSEAVARVEAGERGKMPEDIWINSPEAKALAEAKRKEAEANKLAEAKAEEAKKPVEAPRVVGDSLIPPKEKPPVQKVSNEMLRPPPMPKKQKNTHDNINMSAIDMVGYSGSMVA